MASIIAKDFSLNNIKGVLLDKDGTITNSHIYWAEIIAIRSRLILKKYSLSKKYFDYISDCMGLNVKTCKLKPEGPIALKSKNEVVENVIQSLSNLLIKSKKEEILEIFKNANKIFQERAIKFIEPIDYSVEFINKLKSSDIKVSLVTSDTTDNAIKAMEFMNIKERFDFILGGDISVGKKTTGEPALLACEKMGLNPRNVIAIGDAEMDYLMAKNACLNSAILVATGQNDLEELKKINEMSIENLGELRIF